MWLKPHTNCLYLWKNIKISQQACLKTRFLWNRTRIFCEIRTSRKQKPSSKGHSSLTRIVYMCKRTPLFLKTGVLKAAQNRTWIFCEMRDSENHSKTQKSSSKGHSSLTRFIYIFQNTISKHEFLKAAQNRRRIDWAVSQGSKNFKARI